MSQSQYGLEEIYRIALEQSSFMTAIYTGPEIRIKFVNDLMLRAWGKDLSIIDQPIRQAVPELEGQPFFDYFETVYKTGTAYESVEERADLLVNGTFQSFYYNFSYRPLKYPDGTVWGIVHTATDVTDHVMSKRALQESERNFKNMILQSPVASCIYNGPRFILSVANKRMLELIGKTEDQVLNKPVMEGLPEVKDEGFEQILQKVYNTGEGFEAREQAVPLPRDGKVETVYINFTYTAIRNGEGQVTDVLAVAYDVSDQVKAKLQLKAFAEEKERIAKSLREERERLTQILETMAEGVGIIDVEGNITYANPMAEKILGLQRDEILTRTYFSTNWENLRLDGSALPESEHPMSIAMTTGQLVFDHVIAVQPPDKELIFISINAAPIRNEDGEIVAGIGSFMDVTSRVKLAQQKDEFISVASHELKTPLTSVKAGFQILHRYFDKRPDLPEGLSRIFQSANQNLDKLGALVNDLLNVTKIEKGQLVLSKTTFNVVDLIRECCDHVRFAGTHEIVTSGDWNAEMHADKQKIDQVLVNLVNNAVKYSPNKNKIIVHVETIPGHIKVSVQDFGIGIAKEKASHIFDRFYRVDNSGVQFSGLGLGLYISSEIIRRHNGEIGVQSEPGKGSTFWFSIPV
ncbi:PAS domain-containing protein [Paradesertivirga mongoliensis]|uniref:histidine kinase n=1 Tax=Paradesertivirga mongoliensis TaxID=2100740 RepID=A0ABW4ZR73_9SPHI|nr:PAS domain-containing protein [Pedobacter mongoliensis]